ncbi:FAD-binding protein [Pseudoalteromonas sp. S4498]|uniref:D-2-hydroxyglutarate dehydrogenase YdiJ n=1 Tax=Pseudoalteromonas TaxID=53246 RepID=UPI001107EA5F|nr:MULTISPECIES: FAD-binding and (Fe-S)-binding domain-containing protein [Pseudoalteromonas]MCG9761750.1 FAD-binding oxidoreductase [Pseudoalteromonas sp. Isolate6]NKC20927.1 FAD-binding protein [Pseudoalteromonas galatheae]
MIANISQQDSANELINLYQSKLIDAGFSGDIDSSYATRLVTSTDNSIYQEIPQAVLFPRTNRDVQLALEIAQQDPFLSLTFGPRGGGTGTNGQSLTPGIVIDLSRHMREILEINEQEGWVRVQAGVIKDQLNDFLKPYGYFFSPDLSTSNRATIGGMVNTDASGQGSLVYGKTSDHVLGLKTFLVDGTELNTSKLAIDKAELLAEQNSKTSHIYANVIEICRNNRALILEKFPRLNRFLTGYDLENVFDDSLTTFDLSRIITGSEGSLGVVTEAKLNLTPIQPFKTLINIKYDSFESALRNSPFLVSANATSVETVDSKVLGLAKEDIIWHSVSDLIQDVPGVEMQGLNMVEFNGESEDEISSKVDSLCQRLDQLIANKEAGVIGYQLTNDKADILKIYAMRKKSVGLLGNAKGNKKPLAFAEDTAVPPENLADFIIEFRELLDSYQLDYGMFGHVDAGVLHVRPALDMCDPEQEKLLRVISDKVVALTAKYRGLMWGEHGKGYRSEYGPEFFGEQLFNELRKIKSLFDKNNRLNPGKICTPLDSGDQLVSVDAQKRAWFDRTIPTEVKVNYEAPINCNGNGLCFNYDDKSPMCPSYKVTKDRRNSPKGRAGLFKEWLRLQNNKGVDLIATEKQLINHENDTTWWERFLNTRKKSEYDFSHEVKASMDECLACKACTTACPIKVDVPTFRAKFLNFYYSRYNRPLKDYLVANIERALPTMAKFPNVVNALQSNKISNFFVERLIGYVDSPALSKMQLNKLVPNKYFYSEGRFEKLSDEEQQSVVFVVQDPFTSFYEAELVSDFVQVISKLGFYPLVLPFKPNGKPQHVKGFLKEFKSTASSAAQFLNTISEYNRPLVGLDASLVMCYRDEYNDILKKSRGNFKVQLAHEWLSTVEIPTAATISPSKFTLISHCTETTAMPESKGVWQGIFNKLNSNLEAVNTGCCGMAGTYGHETQNQENSRALYESSWQHHIDNTALDEVLVTGFSCRCQVKRFKGIKPKHPLQALNKMLD